VLVVDFGLLGPLTVSDSARPVAVSAPRQRVLLATHREIGDRWAQAETLGHIGDTRQAAGQLNEARAAWEEALAILDSLRHPDAGQIRAKLAGLGADPAV
jgi:hypothetical protein